MNKVKALFRVKTGASEKSDGISKIRDKNFFVIYLSPTKF